MNQALALAGNLGKVQTGSASIVIGRIDDLDMAAFRELVIKAHNDKGRNSLEFRAF